MVQCYNCGNIISKKDGTETKEHIPAQNLFAGLGDDYKKNRITVPSCLKCNGETTAVDEEFRNLIGSVSDLPEHNEISRNTAKSIITRSEFSKLVVDEHGGVRGVKVKAKDIANNHQKIFKGLFYHQYKRPLPKEYKVLTTFEPTNFTGSCIKYLSENFDWKHSGHPDVFSYILQPFRENLVNNGKKPLIPMENEEVFLCVMKYNNTHAGLGIATIRPIKSVS